MIVVIHSFVPLRLVVLSTIPPQKPFGSCGYELIRVLALEFSLRTRTEAICLRAELLRREFRVDSKSISCSIRLGTNDSSCSQQL